EREVRMGWIMEVKKTERHAALDGLIVRIARDSALRTKLLKFGPHFGKLVLNLVVRIIVVPLLPHFRTMECVRQNQFAKRTRISQGVALRHESPIRLTIQRDFLDAERES